jgi:hypothetical protein
MKSPNLVDSTERLNLDDNNNNNFSEENIKPNLIGNETSTDLKLNLLANQMKITYNNSETEVEQPNKNQNQQNFEDDIISISSSRSSSSSSSSSRRKSSSPVSQVSKKSSVVIKEKKSNDRIRKIELLRIFHELENKGINISQKYNFNSSLEEMEQEYEILKSIQNKKAAVKLYTGFLLNSVQALEFLNESYNPFDFHLKGWSEYVNLGIDDYEEVLAEIYEKWKHTGRQIEPEIKLVLMLATSATTFHASNTILKNVPGLDDMIKKNPNMINNLTKKMVNQPPPPSPPEINVNNRIDPREFLNKMREEQNKKFSASEINDVDIDSISEVVTSTNKRKKKVNKGMTIDI